MRLIKVYDYSTCKTYIGVCNHSLGYAREMAIKMIYQHLKDRDRDEELKTIRDDLQKESRLGAIKKASKYGFFTDIEKAEADSLNEKGWVKW